MRWAALAAIMRSSGVAEAHLDPNAIRRPIKKNLERFAACYDAALKKNPKLGEGTVNVRFTVIADGTARDIVATGMPAINACVEHVISTIAFPRMKKGSVQVSYPFNFRPAAP